MKERETTQLQNKIHEIIFGHTTAAGKAFDIILLVVFDIFIRKAFFN